MAGFCAANHLILFDPNCLQSTLLIFFFFLAPCSRTDKSSLQTVEGQFLVFVFMSPIATEGKETKKEPQTSLTFLTMNSYKEKQTAQSCCFFGKIPVGYM